jgi:hypothetical protein
MSNTVSRGKFNLLYASNFEYAIKGAAIISIIGLALFGRFDFLFKK